MNIIAQTGEIIVRKMEDDAAHFELMAKWLSDERVLEFYEGRGNPYNFERVVAKFGPRVRGDSHVTPCLIEYQNKSIGYVQYFPITNTEKVEYGYPQEDYILGLDMFIGEPEVRGKGIALPAVSCLVGRLFRTRPAIKIVVDPQVWNQRAVRFWEKAGFRPVKVLEKHELHEGEYRDCLLMEQSPPLRDEGEVYSGEFYGV